MDWIRHWDDLTQHEEWNIGLVAAPIHAFLDPAFQPRVRWFAPAPNTFLADPFAMPDEPGVTACEEWDARTDRGRLIVIDREGRRRPLQGFPAGIHLSYPFFVQESGESFCIPEMWESGGVHLYRRVPGAGWSWAHETELLPGFAGVDATLFRHDGRWWMACGNQNSDPESDLYLWWAERVRGPWFPHARNPVKRDRGSSRSGGTPFWHEGALYRPAQDCAAGYGSGVAINRMVRLSPDAFAEETVIRWGPARAWPWNHGFHTLSVAGERGELTLMDARRMTFMPAAFRRVLGRKTRRLWARMAGRAAWREHE